MGEKKTEKECRDTIDDSAPDECVGNDNPTVEKRIFLNIFQRIFDFQHPQRRTDSQPDLSNQDSSGCTQKGVTAHSRNPLIALVAGRHI